MMTDIGEICVDLEQDVPETIWQNQDPDKERCIHEILQLKTTIPKDWTSGACHGAELLQVGEGMCHLKDTALDNFILRPFKVVSKSLFSTETQNSNIEREAQAILHGLQKLHHYCFAEIYR